MNTVSLLKWLNALSIKEFVKHIDIILRNPNPQDLDFLEKYFIIRQQGGNRFILSQSKNGKLDGFGWEFVMHNGYRWNSYLGKYFT